MLGIWKIISSSVLVNIKFHFELNYKQIYNIKLISGFAECGTVKLNYLFKFAGFK